VLHAKLLVWQIVDVAKKTALEDEDSLSDIAFGPLHHSLCSQRSRDDEYDDDYWFLPNQGFIDNRQRMRRLDIVNGGNTQDLFELIRWNLHRT
jgi:hypothetical protein